jgi:protein CpxP
MTRMNSKLSTLTQRTLISVAVAAALAVALPVSAAPAGNEATGASTTMHKKSPTASHVAMVEARITEMHAKLKITQAEEDQWSTVAGVMRDNAKTMDMLVQERIANATTASAIDDLKSYSAIANANAEATQKFVAVFEPLYDAMPNAQKADADALFQGHHARSAAKSHS